MLVVWPLPDYIIGLDASSYRSSAAGGQEDADGAGGDAGGDGGVVDPFEGTEELFLICAKCGMSVILNGSQVRRERGYTLQLLNHTLWYYDYST